MKYPSKPTPGEWFVDTWSIYSKDQLDETGMTREMPILEGGNGRDSDGLANLALCAEAGTVYHETGLTPRELLAQRDKLWKTLQYVSMNHHEGSGEFDDRVLSALEIVTNPETE